MIKALKTRLAFLLFGQIAISLVLIGNADIKACGYIMLFALGFSAGAVDSSEDGAE